MDSKSWKPSRSYQLNSTADLANLAGSSKRTPRIFIYSIALGGENLSYVKSIENYARIFAN